MTSSNRPDPATAMPAPALPSVDCQIVFILTGEEGHGFCSSRLCIHKAMECSIDDGNEHSSDVLTITHNYDAPIRICGAHYITHDF